MVKLMMLDVFSDIRPAPLMLTLSGRLKLMLLVLILVVVMMINAKMTMMRKTLATVLFIGQEGANHDRGGGC